MGIWRVQSRVAVRQLDLWRWIVLAGALTSALTLVSPARAATSRADRTATNTYLRAAYDVALAFAHNRSAANAAEQRTGAAIAAECPKVLAGAPGNTLGSSNGEREMSPRARGEADRHQHQFSALTDEFETTLRVEAFKPDAAPFARFVSTVTPLHWSDPAIAPSVQQEISILRVIFEPATPAAVCADMRFWVASGYRNLSPDTRAFEAGQEGLLGNAFAFNGKNPEQELKRFEGPRERTLAKRTAALNRGDSLESGGPREAPFRKALGIEEASSPGKEPKPTVIGQGTARAGGKFKIEVTRGFGSRCGHIISSTYTVTSSEGSSSGGSSSALRCLAGGVPRARPEVRCEGGAVEVESTTLPATRNVQLTLSDGRTITSRTFPIAKRYGGPAGAYFQAVRGPSPYPVSLSELDAGGGVLRTVGLRAVKHCRQPERKKITSPIVRDLVQGKSPAGRTFTILAGSSVHKGHRTVSFFASGLGASNIETSLQTSLGPGAGAKYLPWMLTVGCQSATESIIYGQLKTPGTTALVATATTPLTPLMEVALPSSLKVTGTLAYAVLTGLPTELVIRDANGGTLVTEDLRPRAKQETEYCAGYGETTA